MHRLASPLERTSFEARRGRGSEQRCHKCLYHDCRIAASVATVDGKEWLTHLPTAPCFKGLG